MVVNHKLMYTARAGDSFLHSFARDKPTMAKTRRFALLFAAATFHSCCASKDDSFYAAGVQNPNVELAMYWKEPRNVLQDLSKFSKLYVQFHSCS
jgi:hypothetical protein